VRLNLCPPLISFTGYLITFLGGREHGERMTRLRSKAKATSNSGWLAASVTSEVIGLHRAEAPMEHRLSDTLRAIEGFVGQAPPI
jgi:hypothetical protein